MEKHMHTECNNILQTLMKDDNAWPFMEPVDPVELKCPTYFDIIKHPMDFETVNKKLSNNEYESFQDFNDDIRLIFSNCLLFNKGIQSRSIRKMAIALRSKFEKLANKVKAGKKVEKPIEVQEKEIWRQCDRCLKWRKVLTDNTKPCRWKCSDLGEGVTCDTPEEEQPTGKINNDANSFPSIVNSILQIEERRVPTLSTLQIQNTKAEIMSDVFSHFIQIAWLSSSLTCDQFNAIIAQYASLGIEPYLLYQEVLEYHKKWPSIMTDLKMRCPTLSEDDTETVIKNLYNQSIQPFEKGWELLQQKASKKREVPSISSLFHGQTKKGIPEVKKHIFCWKCSADIELYDDKVYCAGCGNTCCKSCYNGDISDKSTILCERCRMLLCPSWSDLSVCTACGLDVDSSIPGSYIHCTRCNACVHRNCINEKIDDETNWICKDCRKLPKLKNSVLCRVGVDGESRLVTPVFVSHCKTIVP